MAPLIPAWLSDWFLFFFFLALEIATLSRRSGDLWWDCAVSYHIHVFPQKKNLNHVWKQRGHHFSYTDVGNRHDSCVFCQLQDKLNVWQRRIWVGKTTSYIPYVKIEDIFLLNVAVIIWNSSLQTGNIPITSTWSIAISLHVAESLISFWSSSIYDIFLIWMGSKVKLPELY